MSALHLDSVSEVCKSSFDSPVISTSPPMPVNIGSINFALEVLRQLQHLQAVLGMSLIFSYVMNKVAMLPAYSVLHIPRLIWSLLTRFFLKSCNMHVMS